MQKQIFYVQHINQSYFLLIFAGQIVLHFVIHHWLLWVQKERIQKFSAIFKKSKVNFVLEIILFLWTKGFQTHFCICVNVNVCILQRKLERKSAVCFALFAWFARAALFSGIVKTAKRGDTRISARAYYLRPNNASHMAVGRTMCHAGTKSARPSIAPSPEPQWGLTLIEPLHTYYLGSDRKSRSDGRKL